VLKRRRQGEGPELTDGSKDTGDHGTLSVPYRLALLIYLVTAIAAVALLVAHTFRAAGVTVDTTSLGLLAILLVVPLATYIKSISAGPFKAEIGEREARKLTAQAAGLPATRELIGPAAAAIATDELTINELIMRDPNLALAKLRLEIEQELRRLYYEGGGPVSGVTRVVPIRRMIQELERRQILPPGLASPLDDVVSIANRAVHGASVDREAAREIADVGERVLAALRSIPTPGVDPIPPS
jgi:hypothetical protein